MQDCIFCQIIRGEIPSKKVYEDDNVIAFHDISPKAPVHVLVVPKRHIKSLSEIKDSDRKLFGDIMMCIQKIAEKLEIVKSGYKVVINNGEGAGQLVFHLHLHLLGGWQKEPHWQV